MQITRWNEEDKKRIAKAQEQIDLMGNVWCKMCNRKFPLDIMEVDHIKPKSKGGSDKPRNLQLLCPSCNRKKGAKKQSDTKQKSEFDLGFDPSDIL